VNFVDFDFSRKIMLAINARSKSTHENWFCWYDYNDLRDL